MQKPVLILHNIRSAHNVGAIFRTADAAGVGAVYLTGYTPAPVDRFGRVQKEIQKTALGAEQNLAWEKKAKPVPLIQKLQKAGYEVIALEQAPGAVSYKNVRRTKPLALVVGNEVRGLSKQILSMCDKIADIPMRGKKESLNVSVATGVALFRLLNI
ncbi:MAG: RNA methyltransferase [bacterium]|nr:RNA methyltransferase [bacterium]